MYERDAEVHVRIYMYNRAANNTLQWQWLEYMYKVKIDRPGIFYFAAEVSNMVNLTELLVSPYCTYEICNTGGCQYHLGAGRFPESGCSQARAPAWLWGSSP